MYMIVCMMVLMVVGMFVDWFGCKCVYVIGIVLFGVMLLLCGFVLNVLVFVVGWLL